MGHFRGIPRLRVPGRRPNHAIAMAGFGVIAAIASAPPAFAHPHVLVTARAEILFGAGAEIAAIRHIWQFDPAFSAYAMQGYDANNDGMITIAELAPLAQINVESLSEYGFFTWLTSGDASPTFLDPDEYWLDVYGGQLTLFYTLPLTEPLPVAGEATLEVYDPEYFVAFSFDATNPVTLIGAPAGCSAVYHPPQELDAATAALLAAVPADQRALPADLAGATADLANAIVVTCP
jgi:ABC-type uncharacterized transport system substrate-binding protein